MPPMPPMLDVTVVLLEDGFSSTAIMPVEIFHFAGKLWHDLHDRPAEPAFRVRTVSLDGGAVHGGMPACAVSPAKPKAPPSSAAPRAGSPGQGWSRRNASAAGARPSKLR